MAYSFFDDAAAFLRRVFLRRGAGVTAAPTPAETGAVQADLGK